MAINVYKLRDEFNAARHMEFLCDTPEDIKNLPGLEDCAANSAAVDLSTRQYYRLEEDGIWHEFP